MKCVSPFFLLLLPPLTPLPPQKLNEHCFERCIPKPGTALSSSEEGCFKACMEKYMGAWNTVSKQYVARIQREQAAGGLAL